MGFVYLLAVDRGELGSNVLDRLRRVYHADRADLIWLPQHVDAFLKLASVEVSSPDVSNAHRSAAGRSA